MDDRYQEVTQDKAQVVMADNDIIVYASNKQVSYNKRYSNQGCHRLLEPWN